MSCSTWNILVSGQLNDEPLLGFRAWYFVRVAIRELEFASLSRPLKLRPLLFPAWSLKKNKSVPRGTLFNPIEYPQNRSHRPTNHPNTRLIKQGVLRSASSNPHVFQTQSVSRTSKEIRLTAL